MAVSVVSFSFSMVAQADPEVNYSVCWLSLLHRVYFRLPLYCLPSFSPISHCSQFVGLILPSNSHAVIQTRLNAYATSSDFQRPVCVTFFRCTTLNGIFGRVKRSKHNTGLNTSFYMTLILERFCLKVELYVRRFKEWNYNSDFKEIIIR